MMAELIPVTGFFGAHTQDSQVATVEYVATVGQSGAVHDVQVDTVSRSSGTTYTLGPTFTEVTGFKAGSRLAISYYVPTRNESTDWGGAYIELQVRFNGGAWKSFGTSGYSSVMSNGNAVIGFYHNTLSLDPATEGIAVDFSVQFRIYFASYQDTVSVNGGNNLTVAGSGTATRMGGDNGNQHYTHVIVDEIRATP